MKAFIFDPLWYDLVTNDLNNQLQSAGIETIVTKEIAPLYKCNELFEGNEERVLCINPDYVDWKLTANDYENIPNLNAILGAATSFSWIDMGVANEKNIPVCNVRNFSTQAVAEWAITMLFNVARQVPRLIKDDFPLDFDKDFMKYRGVELKGKTAGIIGLGHNGIAIAERLKGLGLNVVYWSKNTRNDEYEYKELNDIFETADVIVPTFAHNNESDALITDELLNKLKPSAIIIDIVELKNSKKTTTHSVFSLPETDMFGDNYELVQAKYYPYEQCYLRKDRSEPEKYLEQMLEDSDKVEWWYKNGEAQQQYFALSYQTVDEETKLTKLANFYPDYIVRYSDSSIGIYDTKAGRTVTEQPTYDKSDALQAYLAAQNADGAKLSGGILNKRNDGIYVYTGAKYTPDLEKWQRFTI